MDDKERTPLSLLLLILAEEESVLEEYEIQCPDGDATVGDIENRGEEKEPLATDEWHPLRPERVYEREIQHVHDPAEHEGSVIEHDAVKKAIQYIPKGTGRDESKTDQHSLWHFLAAILLQDDLPFRIKPFLDQGGYPPPQQGEQPYAEKGQQEFSHSPPELHPEGHALVLYEINLEPIANHVEVVANFHIRLDQNLDDLIKND